jgi:predicted nucleotidyltransferase
VDFVILYGSRARGTHKRHSDYDLLVGLRKPSPVRFIDRILDFMPTEFALAEPKVFTREELEDLWFHYARTLLDPLYEGIVLVDQGGWKEYQRRFAEVMDAGILRREGTAWVWISEREPMDSPRRQHPSFPVGSRAARAQAPMPRAARRPVSGDDRSAH